MDKTTPHRDNTLAPVMTQSGALKDQRNQVTKDALKTIYLVTVGTIAGLLAGGVLIANMGLSETGHILAVLGWSSLWLSTLAFWSVRKAAYLRLGLCRSTGQLLGLGLLVGVLGMPIASVVASTVREWLGRAPENPQLAYILVEDASLWVTLLVGLCVVVIQPLAEEVLYRGALYSAFDSLWGQRAAIVGSSMLFGALHGELSIIAGTMTLGLAFGILRAHSGSIFPGYLAHVANNGIAFVAVHMA